ncbi:uncharacterized protein [Hoplias malabaricus]|uniref:uncharacterized protein isoform X2 n=1 Tax=Hoplias malabaricus TaxID=27720 RepID=UPI0034629590
MSLDGHHGNGMSGKTWAIWTLLAAVLLSLGVRGDKCGDLSFFDLVTENVLTDHLFEIKIFQRPGELVQNNTIALSIVDSFCLTWLKNKEFDGLDSESRFSRYQLMVSYRRILQALMSLNSSSMSDVEKACVNHNEMCNIWYDVSYINQTKLKEMFEAACSANGTLPECPRSQSPGPSSTTSQPNTTKAPCTCNGPSPSPSRWNTTATPAASNGPSSTTSQPNTSTAPAVLNGQSPSPSRWNTTATPAASNGEIFITKIFHTFSNFHFFNGIVH